MATLRVKGAMARDQRLECLFFDLNMRLEPPSWSTTRFTSKPRTTSDIGRGASRRKFEL
jgi:hypothetical protein